MADFVNEIKVEMKEEDIPRNLKQAIKFASGSAVYVGIPESKTLRPPEGKKNKQGMGAKLSSITNAELLFIHTNGSEANHIPARPVIEPALEDDKERLSTMMASSMKKALDGNISEAKIELEKVGMRGEKVSRAWFTNPKNGWAPNSPRTIAAKIAKRSTNPRPLIDTGELKKSITYFVEVGGKTNND